VVNRALVVFIAPHCRLLVVEADGFEGPEVERAAVGALIAVGVLLAVFVDPGALAVGLLVADVRAALGGHVAGAAREQLLTHADDFGAVGDLLLLFDRGSMVVEVVPRLLRLQILIHPHVFAVVRVEGTVERIHFNGGAELVEAPPALNLLHFGLPVVLKALVARD